MLTVDCMQLAVVGRQVKCNHDATRTGANCRPTSYDELAGKSLSHKRTHLAFAHIRGVRILFLSLRCAVMLPHTHLRDRENHHLLTSSSCVLAKWSAGEIEVLVQKSERNYFIYSSLSLCVLSKADRGHWCSNDHHRLGIRPSSPFGHFLDRHGTRAQKRRWTRFLSSHRRLCVCVRILCCTHGWCADQSIVTTHITRVLGNLIFFGL